MPDVLTKALLLEEAATAKAVSDALFVAVKRRISVVQAFVDTDAVDPSVLAQYLARGDAPFLRQVVAVPELVERLPVGLCTRLLAVPVRKDALTGTVDVVVSDPQDPHPAQEIAFHLQSPVRTVRALPEAIHSALRQMDGFGRNRQRPVATTAPPRPRTVPPPPPPPPRAPSAPDLARGQSWGVAAHGVALPPPAPPLDASRLPGHDASRPPSLEALGASARGESLPPKSERSSRPTPPWGTPVHNATGTVGSESHIVLESDIPIPLTRRAAASVSGGTQRPPPLIDPKGSPLGEGYAVDVGDFRPVVEINEQMSAAEPRPVSMPSFIPGPPPLPPASGTFKAAAPALMFGDITATVAHIRAANERDAVLDLVLTGARLVARKIGLFVAKRGGYLGWACTPEFGDRRKLQTILIPPDVGSVMDEAVQDGLYLGPLPLDALHAPLVRLMRGASRDVAIVPIRVSGKTAVVIVADELGDTMTGTRRLEELSRAAGEAFTRLVQTRR